MSRGIALPAAALALATAIAVPTLAQGAKAHHCQLDVTARLASVKKVSGNPPASGSDVSAGIIDGKICGKPFHGAVRNLNKYPSLGAFDFSNRTFGGKGTYKSSGSGTGTANADGSVTLAGSGSITGGSGKFQGATGSISFTGKIPKNATVARVHTTGNIDY